MVMDLLHVYDAAAVFLVKSCHLFGLGWLYMVIWLAGVGAAGVGGMMRLREGEHHSMGAVSLVAGAAIRCRRLLCTIFLVCWPGTVQHKWLGRYHLAVLQRQALLSAAVNATTHSTAAFDVAIGVFSAAVVVAGDTPACFALRLCFAVAVLLVCWQQQGPGYSMYAWRERCVFCPS
jgi:hypothetical protein